MSKKSKKSDNTGQLSNLDYLERQRGDMENRTSILGSMLIIDQLREALRQALKSTHLSTHQVAGEMSHLLNETISAEMIYSWTRESDELNGRPGRHVPAQFLPAFCQVTGSTAPIEIMGKAIGLFVLPGPEALRSEVAKLDEEIAAARAEKRKRLLMLKEMESDL